MSESIPEASKADSNSTNRRRFLSRASSVAMAGGLVAGYGTLGVMAGNFLYPSRPQRREWLFVTEIDSIDTGDVLQYQTPIGQNVTIRRRSSEGTAEDFLALSSVCPHLGCQVHWEAQNNRFFCPCHNGAFDPSGQATQGPPADAGQSLPAYPLQVENGMLFIQVPVETLG